MTFKPLTRTVLLFSLACGAAPAIAQLPTGNLPTPPAMPGIPGVPGVPGTTAPGIPGVPGVPGASIPGVPGVPGMSGAVPTLGGVLPNLSTLGAGSIAGVLDYCLKNKLLGATGEAAPLLEGLTQKPDVATSGDFLAGQTGQLNMSDGSQLSLDSLPPEMKTKACDMVMKQAQGLL